MITTDDVCRRIRACEIFCRVEVEDRVLVYLPYYSVDSQIHYAPIPYQHFTPAGVSLKAGLDGDFYMWVQRARDSGKISIVIPDGSAVEYLYRGQEKWDIHLPYPSVAREYCETFSLLSR